MWDLDKKFGIFYFFLFRTESEAFCILLADSSVADPDPGSDAFLTLDPGSRIGFFRIPDPKPIFLKT